MARPVELTPEVQSSIARDLAAGLPRNVAAVRAGIAYETLRRWMRWGEGKGRPPKKGRQAEPFRAFCAAVKKAEADAVARNVAIIQKAAANTWQAAAWYLERKYPEDWSAVRGEITELRRQIRDLLHDRYANHVPAKTTSEVGVPTAGDG